MFQLWVPLDEHLLAVIQSGRLSTALRASGTWDIREGVSAAQARFDHAYGLGTAQSILHTCAKAGSLAA
jgi:hypothetical protein